MVQTTSLQEWESYHCTYKHKPEEYSPTKENQIYETIKKALKLYI